MVKVIEQQPRWLARGTAGHQLFQHDQRSKAPQTQELRYDGPLRKIAHRGAEVFVAVGNELRWSDLGLLRDVGGNGGDEDLDADESGEKVYRMLKVPVHEPIQQLSVSPNQQLIAITTSHTCHVAVLPASPHLHSGDTSPMRLKAFQVGPTAHVLEQAPIMATIWHPLSPYGSTLVTVTKDACVRLWELDPSNRSTYNEPSLAIDLTKMANATSAQVDLSASKYGVSNGFSPDNVEMQVAAACFGGQGQDDEHGWSSMTLWVAMGEGDVYALCPFLPSKWRAPASTLPSLSTAIAAKMRATSGDGNQSEAERRIVDQQCKWLAEVDNQDPIELRGEDDFDVIELYSRPEKPSMVPKLQGPFYMTTELDSGEITDIHVIAPKVDEGAFYDEDDEDDAGDDGLNVGIVCLATSNSKVHICLDLDGVEAEWLPPKRSRSFTPDEEEEKDLLLFETVDLASKEVPEEQWPTFTSSPLDRYELFTTTPSGVYNLDFRPWTSALESELANDSDAGVGFRLDVLLKSAKTAAARLIRMPAEPLRGINAAIAVYDPANVGYAVLTAAMNLPFTALLDIPLHPTHAYAPDPVISAGALPAPEPRAPYQPPEQFFQASALPQLIRTASSKHLLGADLKGQVRYSPATLQLMTEAHRILSLETHRLGLAAAELFRRCERMRVELKDQVRKVDEIAQKVDAVVGEEEEEEEGGEGDGDEGTEQPSTGKERIEQRVRRSREKTEELNGKVERLRRRMLALGGKQLSGKERAFAAEVEGINSSLERGAAAAAAPEAPTSPNALLHLDNSPSDRREREHDREHDSGQAGELVARFEAVRALQEKLVKQAREAVQRTQDQEEGGGQHEGRSAAGSEFRRRKMGQVRGLLERETALIEGVGERLGRLQVGG